MLLQTGINKKVNFRKLFDTYAVPRVATVLIQKVKKIWLSVLSV